MNNLRSQLQAQLARYDDDAFAALANRGLLRRARKDLEKGPARIVEETERELILTFAGHHIRFDARGAPQAQCSCPASRVCQHILAAALTLQAPAEPQTKSAPAASTATGLATPASAGESAETSGAASPAVDTPGGDPLEPLRTALLRMNATELTKHCGKAGFGWAWQFVQDLDPEKDTTISGERNLIIGFRHPRISFRYMGGGLDSLLADVDIKQIEKYRVAAVLVFQRAQSVTLAAPAAAPQAGSLDLGKDHAGVESAPAALTESRTRLCAAVRQLARECLMLGLSHFSPGIQERFATLAVWAQGAQAYRLALLLRRLADHVEMLLERAAGADEHRLLDELTLAYALVAALESAAARGSTPAPLLGRARNEYEDAGRLELLGLGARAWRSPSGYIGLTMLFWSPAARGFFSCSDARPEVQRGFDPVARYKASGPWGGFGAPQLATGRRVVLTGAQTSGSGRISCSEKTTATVMPRDAASFVSQLESHSRWSQIARIRAEARRSLLAEPQPMKDWVVLRPTRFQPAEFDQTRQTLIWTLLDDEGAPLIAELAFDKYTTPAIERLEQTDMNALPAGTLVVARLRGGSNNFIAEPLSLVRANASGEEEPVDSLFFDAAPKTGFASRMLSKLRRRAPEGPPPLLPSAVPPLLIELKRCLRRQAERGVAWVAATQAQNELAQQRERMDAAGFTAFRGQGQGEDAAGELLRVQYLCLQYEHLLDDAGEETAV